jgi:hypothetical protein
MLAFLLLGLVGLLAFFRMRGQGERQGRRYPGAEYSVDPAFLAFYDSHGGPQVFGYPLSQALLDAERGVMVQYFERGVLEVGPRQDGVLEVRAAPLGRILGKEEPPIRDGQAKSGCAYYAETGHYVCHQFLEFYLRWGGPDVFGYPIAEAGVEQGRLVQYFEHFRLDWFVGEEEAVRIAPLGMVYWELRSAGKRTSAPVGSPGIGAEALPMGLRVQTSVHPSIGGASGEQEIFVVVSDEGGIPVSGAAVYMVAHFGDELRAFLLPATDQEGRSGMRLTYTGQSPNTSVQLDFWVSYKGLLAETRDSFLIWW